MLRAIGNQHPDLAFDWAIANRARVEGFVEESSRAGYIVELGAGSDDPRIVEKIQAFANTQPEGSRGPAQRVLATLSARKAAAARLRAGVERWLASQRR